MADFSPRSDRLAIAGAGLVLAVVLVAAVWREASPPWAASQRKVREEVAARAGEERAASLPSGLRQIWIPELARVDRCVTCHAAHDGGEALLGAPHPARSHPRADLIAAHPVEGFGCTLCHGGRGPATTTAEAHADTAFWDEPLLDEKRAARYGLSRAELMEVNCNACHRRDKDVPGMPLLNEAKDLVVQKRCVRCHTIDGEGGNTGPDLTYAGEKHPEHFVFPDGWRRPRTALAWHVEHFRSPMAMVADSEMPVFSLTDRQRAALGLLVLSWRRHSLPAAWIPGSSRAPAR